MIKKTVTWLGVLLLIGLVIVMAAACSPSHTTHVSAADKAQAKSAATTLSKCLPSNAVGQLELAKSLGMHSGRAALVAKCGIPPNKRQATEAEILNAAEHAKLTTRGGRRTFTTVTLPLILERNQA